MSAIDESAFPKLFKEESVVLGVAAKTRDEVLAALVDAAAAGWAIDAAHRKAVFDAVMARETLGSTGIGGGIAIPHAKTDQVKEIVTSIGIARTAVDFKAVDGEPCDIFFLLLSPKAMHETHLAILRWLSKLRKSPDFSKFLRRARTPADVVALLEELGS